MRIKEKLQQIWNILKYPTVSQNEKEFLEWLGISERCSRKEMNEITYYTCMKMLSETMGKLPLKFFQQTENGKIRAKPNSAAKLLMNRPNHLMTPATFWSTIEFNSQHYGNAFVWIQTKFEKKGKYGGEYKTVSFWPMQSKYVDVIVDDIGVFGDVGQLYYRYRDPYNGKTYTFSEDNVMHFKTWCSYNGILGKSVKSILSETIEANIESQGYLNNLYKQGMMASVALNYTGELNKEKSKALQIEYESMLSGVKNAGRVVPVPVGMTLQPLNVKLADAQFFELKKYTALQIAAAFGIKPNQINDYDKSSYSSSESQQLAFLVDTMAYRLTQYEQEINAKCLTSKEIDEGYFFKFNEKAILRTDAKTQMENLKIAVTTGIYTVNEARENLDLPRVEGGDTNIVNGTYQPLEKVGISYGLGGEKNGN